MTVVIDPGHGGQDGGAVAADGTAESEINLAVSLQDWTGLLRFQGVRHGADPAGGRHRSATPDCETMRQRKASDLHNRAVVCQRRSRTRCY